MAERQNKIEVVYEYLELMEKEVTLRIPDNATIKDTILHLLERGLIPPKKVRNYMIVKDFDSLLVSNEGNRTHTFMDISIMYVHYNCTYQLWNILKVQLSSWMQYHSQSHEYLSMHTQFIFSIWMGFRLRPHNP